MEVSLCRKALASLWMRAIEPMNRIAVASSTIRAIGYDEKSQTLEVEFKSGGIYQYMIVPKNVHERFMASLSKGKFLAQYIKDKYRTVKIH